MEVEVKATFASPYPDPWLGFQNTKTRSRAVTFALGRNDEVEDFTRGYSAAGLWNPPNWFDNRPGHWGAVVPRFNEMDANLEDRYVVYYAPTPFMYSLERWWLYGENATGLEYCTTRDDEMFAQLFGEWNGHLVGSLDNQDWSAGGRQDY